MLVAGILLRSGLTGWILDLFGQDQPIQRLITAIVLFIFGLALSGAVLGGIGGWLLSLIDSLAPRRRYVWAGAIGYAIPQTVVIVVAFLVVGFLALYHNNMDTQPTHLPLLFALIGLLCRCFVRAAVWFSQRWLQIWVGRVVGINVGWFFRGSIGGISRGKRHCYSGRAAPLTGCGSLC